MLSENSTASSRNPPPALRSPAGGDVTLTLRVAQRRTVAFYALLHQTPAMPMYLTDTESTRRKRRRPDTTSSRAGSWLVAGSPGCLRGDESSLIFEDTATCSWPVERINKESTFARSVSQVQGRARVAVLSLGQALCLGVWLGERESTRPGAGGPHSCVPREEGQVGSLPTQNRPGS